MTVARRHLVPMIAALVLLVPLLGGAWHASGDEHRAAASHAAGPDRCGDADCLVGCASACGLSPDAVRGAGAELGRGGARRPLNELAGRLADGFAPGLDRPPRFASA